MLPLRRETPTRRQLPFTGPLPTARRCITTTVANGLPWVQRRTGARLSETGHPTSASEETPRFLRARANVGAGDSADQHAQLPGKQLSDKQAKDIYAYIRTFKSNAPPLANIPTLNEIVKAARGPYKP